MNRRELENQAEENREVTELLAALPRVEAPANFDFGVRSRIAAGGSKQRSTMFPILKVAVPLSLVLLIGAFVVYYGTMPGDSNTVATTAVQQNYAPEQVPIADSGVPADQDAARENLEPQVTQPVEGKVITASTRPRKIRTARRSTNSVASSESGGGSKDFGLTDASRNVIQAPGTNTTKNPEVPVRDLLEMLGMKVDLASGKWSVLSVTTNSVAERSGVIANDVVESINDQAIGSAAKIKGTGSKTITVGRGGKSIKLNLKN